MRYNVISVSAKLFLLGFVLYEVYFFRNARICLSVHALWI